MARWNSCNLLHVAPDAKRLWQFDAKGGGFALVREQRVPHTETLPFASNCQRRFASGATGRRLHEFQRAMGNF